MIHVLVRELSRDILKNLIELIKEKTYGITDPVERGQILIDTLTRIEQAKDWLYVAHHWRRYQNENPIEDDQDWDPYPSGVWPLTALIQLLDDIASFNRD